MKRGTIEHPKVEALASALGVSLAAAVGHFEALIHFTAKYAPAGDVGKWPDAVIAKRSLWEGDPGEFCRAIVATRFADSDSTSRLIIHDWSEHADDAVHKMLERRGELFADGSEPYSRRGGKKPKRKAKPKIESPQDESGQCRDSGATESRPSHIGNVPARARASAYIKKPPKAPLSRARTDKRRKPVTAFPDGFVLTADMVGYAVGKGIPADRPPAMFEAFEAHHRAKGNRFADWTAAWRTWVQNEIKFHPPDKPDASTMQLQVWQCRDGHTHESPNLGSVPPGWRCPNSPPEVAHG